MAIDILPYINQIYHECILPNLPNISAYHEGILIMQLLPGGTHVEVFQYCNARLIKVTDPYLYLNGRYLLDHCYTIYVMPWNSRVAWAQFKIGLMSILALVSSKSKFYEPKLATKLPSKLETKLSTKLPNKLLAKFPTKLAIKLP